MRHFQNQSNFGIYFGILTAAQDSQVSYNTTLNQHTHIQGVRASFLLPLVSICTQVYLIQSSAGSIMFLGVRSNRV